MMLFYLTKDGAGKHAAGCNLQDEGRSGREWRRDSFCRGL